MKNYKNNQSLLGILDAIAKSLQSETTTGDKVQEQGHNIKEMLFIMINCLAVI